MARPGTRHGELNIDFFRFVDRNVGGVLCPLLTACHRFANVLPGKTIQKPPKKILIIKLSEMGSTVLAYPAFLHLQRRWGPIELFFLTFHENKDIVSALAVTPDSRIVTIRHSRLLDLLRDILRAFLRLKSERIDVTLDMDFFSRLTAALAFLICRGSRVGFHAYTEEGLYRGDLLTHRVLYNPHLHTSHAFLTLAHALDGKELNEPLLKTTVAVDSRDIPSYTPNPEAKESMRHRISDYLAQAGPWKTLVLVNPNSSAIFPLRKWPLGHFAAFCRLLLSARSDVAIALTGSKSEVDDAAFITSHLDNVRCFSLAGQTTFNELLALYSIAKLMVTNDSGPAHFAALLRLPTVVLFGPETPRLYKPLGDFCKVVYAGLACSPCVSVYNNKKSTCTDNQCLSSIDPQKVLQEALSSLPPLG